MTLKKIYGEQISHEILNYLSQTPPIVEWNCPTLESNSETMLTSLRNRMERMLAVDADDSEVKRENVTNLAATALLLEAAQVDCEFSNSEIEQIKTSLVSKFGILEHDIDELLRFAQNELQAATCLHELTSTINANWDLTSKIKLVEALWRVVLSDQHLDPHEQHLMRKLQGLLYIPQAEYIAAKIRASSNR